MISEIKDNDTNTHNDYKSPCLNLNLLGDTSLDLEANHTNLDLEIISRLENLIKNSNNLTKEQRWEFCETQRYYIKLYLKNINKKIQ